MGEERGARDCVNCTRSRDGDRSSRQRSEGDTKPLICGLS